MNGNLTVRRQVVNKLFVYTCDEIPGLESSSYDDRLAHEDIMLFLQAAQINNPTPIKVDLKFYN